MERQRIFSKLLLFLKTISLLASTSGIEKILILFKGQFIICKYVFGAVRQPFSFFLIYQTCFSFESDIIFVHLFDIIFRLSKSFPVLPF